MTNRRTYGIINLAFAGVAHLVERDLAKVEVASSSLVARSKKERHDSVVSFLFLERRFCFTKAIACGRMIERERGNPQRFPPHTPPSLRSQGVQYDMVVSFLFWSVTVLRSKTGRLFIFSCLPLWGRWIAAKRQDERGEPDLGTLLPIVSAEGHSPSVGFADSSLTEGAERTVGLREYVVFRDVGRGEVTPPFRRSAAKKASPF